ncbi:sensor histidine kinase [Paenibacillus kobensis]|uniref:sensor histidine kinase n=1 Tax=Paenibacillus kobensis TaxID=59841 RepID=UPI000FD75B2F|nr:HAMP domain-containing sensor histidine kinase [Paenibacillus kobensis]
MTAASFMQKLKLSPRSLRSQLLARSLLILAALLLLIGALQYVIMRDFLYRNQAESMMSELRNLPHELFDGGGPFGGYQKPYPKEDHTGGGSNAADKDKTSSDNGMNGEYGGRRPDSPFLFMLDKSLAIIDVDGTFINVSADTGVTPPQLTGAEYDQIRSKSAPRNAVHYQVAVASDGTEQLLVFLTLNPGSGQIIQLGQTTKPLTDLLMRQLLIFAALSILALAGGLLLYLPILRRTLRPLNRMVETVERIDAGSLNERSPSGQGQLEIDRLADSFNGMLERLERSFQTEREAKEQMRRFIADASHELRTPLTSIHGFIEVLLRGAAERKEQLYMALNSMHGESTRIKKLVEDLLTLAKLDRAPQLHLSTARLDLLMAEMEPHMHMLAEQRLVRFEVKPNVQAVCDTDKIKQVILNLFHNAVQHTDSQNGEIEVSLYSADHHAVISIRDNGGGIAADHLLHVFDRFYRSDVSRTRKHGGAGLGLSISQSIIEAHGGTISVDSTVGTGSSFTFTLPTHDK